MFLLDKSFWTIETTINKGRGVFAKKTIPAGTVIGDYVGKLVNLAEVDYEKEKENMYLMYYSDTLGIYPDLAKPGIHLLNHSCSPNSFMYNYKGHTLVFALRNIKENEEITISYLLPPKVNCNDCTHTCYCGTEKCTGSMHLSEDKYKIWQKFQKRNYTNTGHVNEEKEELMPLPRYPDHIPKSYIEKINNMGIIS